MFHRPPKKYSEYLVNIEQSIDWILKTLWKLKKGEFAQNLQEVTDEGNTTTNIIDTAGTKSDYFQLDTAATPTLLPGMFGWNDSDGTANLRLKGNNVTLQVGQETVARVVNKTGADLLESQYKVVRVRIASEGGAQGQRLAVVLAQGNNDPDSATTLGLVTETIANNQEGFITIFGNVNGINTTGSLQGETWLDGDVLYLSPTVSGALTKVKPIAPQHTVIVGYVLYAHNNQGKIFVKVDNGYELDELHNVRITSVANSDLLQYDSTLQVWKNVAASVPATPTLAQVTTAGNTTTNAITVGGLTVDTNTLFVDATNDRVGIGTVAPTVKLHVVGEGLFSSSSVVPLSVTSSSTVSVIRFTNSSGHVDFGRDGTSAVIQVAGVGRIFVLSSGNVNIGSTTTDAGFKLDVNGSVRMSGTTYFGTTNNQIQQDKRGGTTASSYLTLLQDGNNRTFTFYQRASIFGAAVDVGMEVGAGFLTLPYYQALIGAATTTSNAKLISTGSITATSLLAQGVYFNNTLVAAVNNDVLVGLDIQPAFTNGAFTGVRNIAARVKGNLISEYASARITATPTSNTQSHGFNSLDGSEERMFAGYIGSSTLYGTTLSAYFGSPAGYKISFGTVNTIHQTIFTNGNVAINTTTDAGYKLDVNGTARVSGNTSISAGNLSIFTTNTPRRINVQQGSGSICSTFGMYDGGGSLQAAFGLETVSTNALQMASTAAIRFYSGSVIGNAVTEPTNERMRLFSNGNLAINTTTDSGQKLQVIGSVFIKGADSLSSTKVFEVQNGAGASIMDFRNATYAFFGCGQGGGSNSGFIFNYSNTSYTQFAGYNYGAGAGSYKPILMDTDTGGRNQGIFVNFGVTTNTPPNSDTEFGVLGRTSDSTTYISRFRNSGNTDKFAIRADGALFTNTLQGYSGTLNIPTNPPGSTNITITNGIITGIA